MSLKAVTTLTFAVLVAQSTAFFIKSHSKYYHDLPSLTFTSQENNKLSLNSGQSQFSFYERVFSQSEWSFIPGDGSATVVQKVKFPFLWSTYEAFAKANGKSADGYVSVMLAGVNFTLTLTATGQPNNCNLKVKISSPKTIENADLLVYFTGLEEVGTVFEETAVLQEFKTYVWGLLSKATPLKLKTLVPPYLEKLLDTDELCEELLAGTPEDYPHPKLDEPR